MTDTLEQCIRCSLTNVDAGATIWVAYSGGVDSTVLLHALSQLHLNACVKAVHVNHGLSSNANAWQQQCEKFAAYCDVECVSFTVNVHNEGKGLEYAARRARYDKFVSVLKEGDVLLTGHHMSDQVETFFLRLFRGTGLWGLQSMPKTRSLGLGQLRRPLLNIHKKHIEQYANTHRLSYISDESNDDARFARNFLRNQVLPLVGEKWPAYENNILRGIENVAEGTQLLADYVQSDIDLCEPRKEVRGHSISFKKLITYSQARSNHVIRQWILQLGFLPPTAAQLTEINKLIHAAKDANPVVNLGEYQIRRFQQRMYCLKALPITPSSNTQTQLSFLWDSQSKLVLPDGSVLSFESFSQDAIYPNFTVRFRRGGERCKPLGRAHSQSLKKLFHSYAIPTWLRDAAPLIYMGEELVAVGNFWVCSLENDASLDEAYRKWEFSWQYS